LAKKEGFAAPGLNSDSRSASETINGRTDGLVQTVLRGRALCARAARGQAAVMASCHRVSCALQPGSHRYPQKW